MKFFKDIKDGTLKVIYKKYFTLVCQGVVYVCPAVSAQTLAERINRYRTAYDPLSAFSLADIQKEVSGIMDLMELDSVSAEERIKNTFKNAIMDSDKSREIMLIINSTFYAFAFHQTDRNGRLLELSRLLGVRLPPKPESSSASPPKETAKFDWE